LVNVPPLPEGEDVVGIPYEFSPNGATFYPAITITFSYDPATVSDTTELKIVFWNGSEWVELTDVVVDETTGTVTGKTTHFTKFALIAVPKPIVTTTTPTITPTVTPTETTPVVTTTTTIPTQTTTITPTVEPTVEPTQTTTSTVTTTTTTPIQTISPTQTTTPTTTVKPDSGSKTMWFIVGIAVILVLALVIFLVKNRRKPTL
jgi:cobalamin biosynthesis Mg chelatase CobN